MHISLCLNFVFCISLSLFGKIVFPILGPQVKRVQSRDSYSTVLAVFIFHETLYIRPVCLLIVFDDGFAKFVWGGIGVGIIYGTNITLVVKLESPSRKDMCSQGIILTDGDELACIAGISLLVGGIGIMNIMYVSVTERTKEIGLRMSVGARSMDILAQFLIEAVLISITGGILGIILGCGASAAVKYIAHWPVDIQTWSAVLSFAVCTVTGIFFGWYPARKASNLDPIDALRYE